MSDGESKLSHRTDFYDRPQRIVLRGRRGEKAEAKATVCEEGYKSLVVKFHEFGRPCMIYAHPSDYHGRAGVDVKYRVW